MPFASSLLVKLLFFENVRCLLYPPNISSAPSPVNTTLVLVFSLKLLHRDMKVNEFKSFIGSFKCLINDINLSLKLVFEILIGWL